MKEWTQKAERGSAWLIRLIAWLAHTAGRPLCRALLYPIVLYFMLTDRTARRASEEFLRAARGRPVRWRDSFVHLHSFASTLLDRVYMAGGEFGRFQVTIEGLELLERALSAGRGCLLLGSHLGSFDLMLLAQRAMDGRRVHVMMRIDPRTRVRRIAGINDDELNVIPLGRPDSYLRAHAALDAGEIVAALADRTDGSAQLPARFLGRTVQLPIAPHVLAARKQTPVLMCFGLYQGSNRYLIEFVEFGPVAPQSSRGEDLKPSVERYASILESYARRHPLNWFNFYPYWQEERAAA